ncbi:hypothetical protein HF086_006527 [Spodoptera exigua]|uniref:N-acetyltransferase domain-containing protein n=1 Tax=Spodoptera exigua TaxID=7107 RepID=A0A922MLL7_SPOEX|nr:hypothetical protein HF086_006527 [Spodoptera exigua]
MDWAVPGGMPEVNDIFDEVTKSHLIYYPKTIAAMSGPQVLPHMSRHKYVKSSVIVVFFIVIDSSPLQSASLSLLAVQDLVARIIDQLGEESASAQGLNKVITSAEKLRKNPGHIVYLLKDHRGKEGKGEIIGLLKVGRKHLFLFDSKEVVHEVEPLCVLDFYVELEVTAWQMAIDGPSEKMEKFLSRNFGIEKLIRQNNNFAVAPNFFDRSDEEISSPSVAVKWLPFCTSNSGGGPSAAPAAAVGRFAAPKPASAIANVIHGAGHEHAARR